MLDGLRFINISVEILTFQVIYLSIVREYSSPLQSLCLIATAVRPVFAGRLSLVHESFFLFRSFPCIGLRLPLSMSYACNTGAPHVAFEQGSRRASVWRTRASSLSAV